MQRTHNQERDHVLRSYFSEVRRRHGYMRFLGLPYLRDTPDVDIAKLYVPPAVSAQLISPDTPLENWPATESPLDALARKHRLILLGDPGSGKSTLVNWLAWRLSAGLAQPLPEWMEGLIPIPIVLRELHLKSVKNFDSLIEAFFEHSIAQALNSDRSTLEDHLKAGRVLFLIDGLDEVRLSERKKLRLAIWDGWVHYPKCYWLLTSRVVGYEEAPLDLEGLLDALSASGEVIGSDFIPDFDVDLIISVKDYREGTTSRAHKSSVIRNNLLHNKEMIAEKDLIDIEKIKISKNLTNFAKYIPTHSKSFPETELAYVVPFDDERIKKFARNWYLLREQGRENATIETNRFMESLEKNPGTWRLARTPNLLIMMALIFRVRARLPDGRALLYSDIALAYLESIDEYRGLREDRFPLTQKKRWLARVAFEMQWRRWQHAESDPSDDDMDLLVPQAQVREWIIDAMQESGYGEDEKFADQYLDFVIRRSGLLLPRGDGRYAFLHLSFQEYFAAWYLSEQIRHPLWQKKQRAGLDARVSPKYLKIWGNNSRWHETLVFLFEILGQEPGWADLLSSRLFGAGFSALRVLDKSRGAAQQWCALLLARVAGDPHSGLGKIQRQGAVTAICHYTFKIPSYYLGSVGSLLSILFEGEESKELVWSSLNQLQPTDLELRGCGQLDWSRMAKVLPNVKRLDIGSGPVGDLRSLQLMKSLRILTIRDAPDVMNVDFLYGVKLLNHLSLFSLAVEDLSPLKELHNLTSLNIGGLPSKDFRPIINCPLQALFVSGPTDLNIDMLTEIASLKELYLTNIEIKNLRALTNLKHLESLYMWEVTIIDPRALLEFKHLETMQLTRVTGVNDVIAKQLGTIYPNFIFHPTESDEKLVRTRVTNSTKRKKIKKVVR